MPTPTQLEVLFADGEALILSDLHNMQRFLRSQVLDTGIGAGARMALHNSGIPDATISGFALCPHAGAGYPKPGAGTRQITNMPGMIYQWVATGAPTGQTVNLLSYQLSQDELLQTLGANASGNPRIDALCIQLSYNDTLNLQTRDFQDASTLALSSQSIQKMRSTVLSQTVVAGTPAATPTIPATPAGYCVYAYVWVPNGYASAFTEAHIMDNRMPMRVASVKTLARMGLNKTVWSISSDGYRWTDGGVTSGILFMPFPGGAECRILQVNTYGSFLSGAAATVGRLDLGAAGGNLATSLAQIGPGNANNEWLSNPDAAFGTNMYLGKNGNGPTLWGNGFMCGAYAYSVGDYARCAKTLSAYLTGNGANTQYVMAVEWFYAY